jgi:hypothetical protein
LPNPYTEKEESKVSLGVKYCVMKVYRRRGNTIPHILDLDFVEVSSQFHVLFTLLPGKEPKVFSGIEAGWVPELF